MSVIEVEVEVEVLIYTWRIFGKSSSMSQVHNALTNQSACTKRQLQAADQEKNRAGGQAFSLALPASAVETEK